MELPPEIEAEYERKYKEVLASSQAIRDLRSFPNKHMTEHPRDLEDYLKKGGLTDHIELKMGNILGIRDTESPGDQIPDLLFFVKQNEDDELFFDWSEKEEVDTEEGTLNTLIFWLVGPDFGDKNETPSITVYNFPFISRISKVKPRVKAIVNSGKSTPTISDDESES